MTIWGELRLSWRNVLPPVLVLTAIACLALSMRGCLWPGSDRIPETAVFEQYVRQLDSSDPGTVAAGIKLLGELGNPKAVPAIRPKLDAADPRVIGVACAALGRLGDQESTETLLRLVSREDSAIAAGAAEGLGALRCKKAVEPIQRLLGSRNAAARLAAIIALGEIGEPAAAQAMESLERDPCAGLDPRPADDERAHIEDALRQALAKLRGGSGE